MGFLNKLFNKGKVSSGNYKGIIRHYKLNDWWDTNFNDSDKEKLIQASLKVTVFGIELIQPINFLTEEDKEYLRVTPLDKFICVYYQIEENDDTLKEKFRNAVDTLIPYYLSETFNIDAEYKRLLSERTYELNQMNEYKNVYLNLEIECYLRGIALYHYKKKKNTNDFNICLKYSQIYLELSDRFLKEETIQNIRAFENSDNPLDLPKWRQQHLYKKTNKVLENYVYLLQLENDFDGAYELIEKIEAKGYEIDWSKRLRIIESKRKKFINQ